MGFLWSDLVSSVETQVVRAREVMMAIKRKAPCNASTPAFFSAQRADCFHQLQRMLDGGCLKVYLQPKAVIATGEIRGAEALSRIVGPDNTILMPGHFIPQLEQQGLIRHVDFFVLQEICRALARWKHAGRQLMPISLNFSLSTLLEPDVVGTICALTDQYEVERRLIEIEITQSVGEKEWDTIVSVG
ncbi:MAG: EAL domain-containing protein, partial [Oscillospiraceae bacterium]